MRLATDYSLEIGWLLRLGYSRSTCARVYNLPQQDKQISEGNDQLLSLLLQSRLSVHARFVLLHAYGCKVTNTALRSGSPHNALVG